MSKEYEKAIKAEVEHWPGVQVEFVNPTGKGHPKAKFTFTPAEGDPLTMSRPYAGTPSDAVFGVHRMLGDMRRAMKSLGAERDKPEPTKDEDEAPYRKPNDGREKRPDPVKREPAALPRIINPGDIWFHLCHVRTPTGTRAYPRRRQSRALHLQLKNRSPGPCPAYRRRGHQRTGQIA